MSDTSGTPVRTGGAPPGVSARRLALDVLVRVEAGAYSNLALPAVLRRSTLSARDRAFVTSLVYGTLREQRRCDHLVALVCRRRLGTLEPRARAALRLGVHQLLAGIPAHAAVGATVGAIPVQAGGLRRFVNGVLRGLVTVGPPWPWPEGDDPASIGVRTSQPDWIVERALLELGADDGLAALGAMSLPPPVTLRPNPLRTSSAALAGELAAGGAEARGGSLVPRALVVESGLGDPARMPAVAEGRATPQDEASQAVVTALGARPGERILDIAAAPGGKSTGLAEEMGDSGVVFALDLREGRARRIREAARRLGLDSVRVAVADGRALPVGAGAFDRVLCDAPCSGLGALRRRPEARWRLDPQSPLQMAGLQRELLVAAASAVRPGGVLAYCVCTWSEVETLGIDRFASSVLGEFVVEHGVDAHQLGPPWRPFGRGVRLLPSDAGTDGMYLLLLRRRDFRVLAPTPSAELQDDVRLASPL